VYLVKRHPMTWQEVLAWPCLVQLAALALGHAGQQGPAIFQLLQLLSLSTLDGDNSEVRLYTTGQRGLNRDAEKVEDWCDEPP